MSNRHGRAGRSIRQQQSLRPQRQSGHILDQQQQQPSVSNVARKKDNFPQAPGPSHSSKLPADIPGYYYDVAQNKYFRVQQNHQATSGAFSHAAVAQKREADVQRSRDQAKKARKSHRFKRSPLLSSSIVAALYRQEIPTRCSKLNAKDCVRLFYASDLHGSSINDREPRVWFNANLFAVGHDATRGALNVSFHYNALQKLLLIALINRGEGHTYFRRAVFCAALGRRPFAYLSIAQAKTIVLSGCAPHGFSTSIRTMRCLHHAPINTSNHFGLQTPKMTSSTGHKHLILFPHEALVAVSACLVAPRSIGPSWVHWSPITVSMATPDFNRLLPRVCNLPTLRSDFDIVCHKSDTLPTNASCVAIRPDGMLKDRDPLRIEYVAGDESSHSAYNVSLDGDECRVENASTISAVTAVAFANSDTWIFGLRNGFICSANGASSEWQHRTHVLADHGGAIANLHVLRGSTYLIANGVKDKMYLYRLKANKNLMTTGTKINKRRGKNELEVVVRYDHRNGKYPSDQLGFTVCEELEMIAAAQDDGTIKIFSIYSGLTLAVLSAKQDPREARNALPPMFTTIQIVPEETGFCRILAARRGRIYDFAHHYDQDEA